MTTGMHNMATNLVDHHGSSVANAVAMTINKNQPTQPWDVVTKKKEEVPVGGATSIKRGRSSINQEEFRLVGFFEGLFEIFLRFFNGFYRKESKKKSTTNASEINKPKQRRYRTERPFACPHCPARFTLRLVI